MYAPELWNAVAGGISKALRLMKQAEKFKRPVITFVNTSGAFCGMEAEERGQGEAIARNLYEMSGLKVPVLCIMIGEGGSGGALALSVGKRSGCLRMRPTAFYRRKGCIDSLEGWQTGKRSEWRHENYRAGFKSARRD